MNTPLDLSTISGLTLQQANPAFSEATNPSLSKFIVRVVASASVVVSTDAEASPSSPVDIRVHYTSKRIGCQRVETKIKVVSVYFQHILVRRQHWLVDSNGDSSQILFDVGYRGKTLHGEYRQWHRHSNNNIIAAATITAAVDTINTATRTITTASSTISSAASAIFAAAISISDATKSISDTTTGDVVVIDNDNNSNNRPYIHCHYSNGQLHGDYTAWYETGNLHLVTCYQHGDKHGKFTSYHDGKQSHIYKQCWYQQGKYRRCYMEYQHNAKLRILVIYDDNGKDVLNVYTDHKGNFLTSQPDLKGDLLSHHALQQYQMSTLTSLGGSTNLLANLD